MGRRFARIIGLAAVPALVAAACTSDPDAGDGGAGAAAGGTSRGLTDDTIRIGFIGADFGPLAEAGLAPDLGDQAASAQAFVDEINEDGGIAGRQVELRLTLVDGTGGPQAGQAACLEMTQDFGAFVVIVAPAVTRDVTRCVTVSNETLAIGATGWDRAIYDEAEGRLFTAGTVTSMSTDRQYVGWARLMHGEGELEGRTIGVVTSQSSPEFVSAAEDALVPELEALGYEVAVNAVLPCPEGDADCDQHEAAVQRMKDAGVDFVFMAAANLSGPTFVQAAQNLDFAPRWAANGNQVTDTVAQFFESVKGAWDGAVGTSTVFALEDDLSDMAHECNEVVSRRSGETYEPGSDAFGFTAATCGLFRVLERGAEAVDGDLDQASLIAAIEALGEVELSAGPAGSLSADKHDAGDHLFLADYRADVGEFVQRQGDPVAVDG